jgi:hypothetical protein
MIVHVGKQQSDWIDMSDYVVHFTKACDGQSPYNNMLSILAAEGSKREVPSAIWRCSPAKNT